MTIEALAAIVGTDHVFGSDAVEPRYLDDETGGEAGHPIGMVRPGDTRQVSAVLARCHAIGQPVVVQGGRTGMARGGVPRTGELILSLERMASIEAIDGDAGLMTVGAGCVLEAAQSAAAEAGWRLAVDIGARGSCTIGGMIATNAGGNQVLRYGMMRDQVLGLEAVLADGTIISSLGGMLKNNTGYDLKQFFIGSEGTLGIVTRAVLRLRPPAIGRQTTICAVADYPAAVRLLARLERAMPGQLSAFELMWSDFFQAACACIGQPDPFAETHALIVLAETESADADALTAALEESFGDGTVSAPIGAIGGLVTDLRERLRVELPGSRPICFGHIADSNLHLALELASEAQRPVAEAIVYDAVRAVGGSVSAEHGIGMLKRAWLGHSRSAEEIAMMRTIRAALDPKGILNPDRIF
jgi:FAD/FMN-containing dehydrogenase